MIGECIGMVDLQLELNRLATGRQRYDEAVRLQADVWLGSTPEKQPLLLTCSPSPELDMDWPVYNYLEIHNDPEKMFSNGLREAVLCAIGGAEAVPSIRANMGCGIIPTMFGVEQMLFEDKMPWVKGHLSKGLLKEMTPEDLTFHGDMETAFSHMAYMSERMKGTGCRLFPIDLQGAFDTAHIVYGDAIFLDLYDDPDFVHHLLDLSCHAIEKGMDACLSCIPDSIETIAHYNNLAMPRCRGGVKISEDTSTLLSQGQIKEFVVPYMSRLLKHFNGGYVHYCGENPHLFAAVMSQELAYGLNFGNPEKHDMEYVLERCSQAGKIYYGSIPKEEDETFRVYFERYLDASKSDDRSILLLTYSCRKEETESVLNSWHSACKNIGVNSQSKFHSRKAVEFTMKNE
jgi:hypothetical protein